MICHANTLADLLGDGGSFYRVEENNRMRLIGMWDSPYVRRVAISLKLMEIPFEADQVSVFRHFDAFAAINPVVKAPTLVTDDGLVLMDSTLILDHAVLLAAPGRQLMPTDLKDHARAQRILGLALAACEKAVQIVYEHNLRPTEKLHRPWLERVQGQLSAALRLLEDEMRPGGTSWLFGPRPLQPDITSAVAWRFISVMVDEIKTSAHPRLAEFSQRAEALPEFVSTPFD
jgi:glutathione S-transferase